MLLGGWIFLFLYFDLFQVKVQLVSKCYWWITLVFVVWIVSRITGMKLDLIVMFCRLFSWYLVLRYVHIARRSRLVVNEISRNKVVVPEGAAGVITGHFCLVEVSFTLNFLSCDSAWSDYLLSCFVVWAGLSCLVKYYFVVVFFWFNFCYDSLFVL